MCGSHAAEFKERHQRAQDEHQSMGIKDDKAHVSPNASSVKVAPTSGGVTVPGVSFSRASGAPMSLVDLSAYLVNPNGMTIGEARLCAQRSATQYGIVMVVGWQLNDTTGEKEYGYCPLTSVSPAFIVEVLETVQPAAPRQVRS